MPNKESGALISSCMIQPDAGKAMQCSQPHSFMQDDVSEHPERFFVGEIIREKIFEQYQQEIPYATMVWPRRFWL